MRAFLRFLLSSAIAALLGSPATRADEQWIPLFNGRDLEGWTPKIAGHELGVNALDTFRVENGAICVRYDRYTQNMFGHLFYRQPFTRYRLRSEYRFVDEQCPGGPGWAKRNSGVMIHCQPPETMRKGQSFPVSIEVQFLGGLGEGDRSTANLCTPGTLVEYNGQLDRRHCINSSSPTFHGDQWVAVEIEVDGGRKIVHKVNGQPVMEYANAQYDPDDRDAKALIREGNTRIEGGYIALQAESHPIEFRRVDLLPLPDAPAVPR